MLRNTWQLDLGSCRAEANGRTAAHAASVAKNGHKHCLSDLLCAPMFEGMTAAVGKAAPHFCHSPSAQVQHS